MLGLPQVRKDRSHMADMYITGAGVGALFCDTLDVTDRTQQMCSSSSSLKKDQKGWGLLMSSAYPHVLWHVGRLGEAWQVYSVFLDLVAEEMTDSSLCKTRWLEKETKTTKKKKIHSWINTDTYGFLLKAVCTRNEIRISLPPPIWTKSVEILRWHPVSLQSIQISKWILNCAEEYFSLIYYTFISSIDY